MTKITDVNKEIAKFLGPDPDTLINMGKVHVAFKDDVAELLKEALLHVNKMRVMKELLEFAEGSEPVLNLISEGSFFSDDGLTLTLMSIDIPNFHRYASKFKLWRMVNKKFCT